jgi:hypothetical protein
MLRLWVLEVGWAERDTDVADTSCDFFVALRCMLDGHWCLEREQCIVGSPGA